MVVAACSHTYKDDTSDAATNIVLGALGATAAGLPKALATGVLGGSTKGEISQKPNVTGALPDSEAGMLVERNVLDASTQNTVNLNAQASISANKVTAPIDFEGHIFSAKVKPNGNVVGGHSTASGRGK